MPQQWVIPDTHGYLKTLKALLEEQIRPSKFDEIFFLGDFIDRGPDSKGLIDYLIQLKDSGYQLRFLKGNHEEWCIKSFEQELQLKKNFLGLKKPNLPKAEWMRFGGKETLKSFKVKNMKFFPTEYIEWMQKLEYYIELDGYYLVHAGFNFETDSIFDDRDSMLWIRNFKVDPEKVNHKIIIHGHVPVSHEFIDFAISKGRYPFIPLDNGVYIKKKGFGNLTAFEIKQRILLVQSNLDD